MWNFTSGRRMEVIVRVENSSVESKPKKRRAVALREGRRKRLAAVGVVEPDADGRQGRLAAVRAAERSAVGATVEVLLDVHVVALETRDSLAGDALDERRGGACEAHDATRVAEHARHHAHG